MNLTTTSSSATSSYKSKIPTLNSRNIRQGDTMVTGTAKTSFDKGKTAGELKQRLASAVSAKIAATNREGRTSSNNNNNRGIEYLLQRKQQHDNKLNTKDLSFQKPIPNNKRDTSSGEKIDSRGGVDLRSGISALSRRSSQKSLLNALMSSKVASGTICDNKKSITSSRSHIVPTSQQTSDAQSTLETSSTLLNLKPTIFHGATVKGNKNARNFARLTQKGNEEKSLAGTKGRASPSSEDDRGKRTALTKESLDSRPTAAVNLKHDSVSTSGPRVMTINDFFLNGSSKKPVSLNMKRKNIPTNSKEETKNASLRNKVAENTSISRSPDKYQENLLEKLEADVASCKITAFQSMEDFSVLRMRVYRIRGDLEQMKKERERWATF